MVGCAVVMLRCACGWVGSNVDTSSQFFHWARKKLCALCSCWWQAQRALHTAFAPPPLPLPAACWGSSRRMQRFCACSGVHACVWPGLPAVHVGSLQPRTSQGIIISGRITCRPVQMASIISHACVWCTTHGDLCAQAVPRPAARARYAGRQCAARGWHKLHITAAAGQPLDPQVVGPGSYDLMRSMETGPAPVPFYTSTER